MLDGLWKVQFHSPITGGFGAGVVVFSGNTVMGGDSSYYYQGTYNEIDGNITSNITITKHSEGTSIFGNLQTAQFTLQGKLNLQQMQLEGSMVRDPKMRLQVKLVKL